MKRLGALTGRLLSGAAVAAVAVTAAAAQTDEIIVTATKREQSLQQVPIAVSVVDDRAIEQSGAQDLFDLQTLVPSLRVSQLQNSSQTNFIIRGFGNGANNVGIESSVGVFIDGVYRSRSAAAILDLPVLERVEILRGPQSTLFGKNVSAGAISITTKEPQFELGGTAEVSYGKFDEVIFRGTVTGPLSDKVAFRLSGSTNNRDGYYTNVVDGSDVNERSRWAVRADMIFEPSESLKFRLIGDYNKIDEVCCGAVQLFNAAPTTGIIGGLLGRPIDAAGDRDYSVAYDAEVSNQLTGKGVSLQGDLDLGGAAITSITAYREQSDNSQTDIDFSGGRIGTNPQDRSFETFTQELRIASTGENRVDWLVGGFLFDEKVRLDRDVTWGADMRGFANALTGGALPTLEGALSLPAGTLFAAGQGYIGNYEMDNRSYSVFGTVDIHLAERLTLSGGVSYIYDKKEYTIQDTLTDVFSQLNFVQIGFAQIFQGLTGVPAIPANLGNPIYAGAVTAASTLSTVACTPSNTPACNPLLALRAAQFFVPPTNIPPGANAADDGEVSDDKIAYTARLAFDATDWLNLYGTYSKGWKASAVNLSSDSRVPDPVTGLGREAGPEDVTLYEVGFKAQFDGGYINAAVFDQTIEGFQSNIFTGTGFVLANAGEQSVRGFEIDSGWSPMEALSLTAGVTYLDPNYDSFVNAPCATFAGITLPAACTTGATFDASGLRPAGISKWSTAVSATYNMAVGDSAEGYIRGEYQYESNVQSIENVSAAIASREVNNVNLSGGIVFENGLELQLWARNVLNKTWIIQAFPTVAQSGSFSGYLNEPRTYGATVRMSF
jgi:iron complex outermembrane receptor protein